VPFVYAFWAGRPGLLTRDDVNALQRTRDEALTQFPAIAELYFPGDASRRHAAERYLRDNIRYRLGAEEREGLERFYRYAAEAGVIPQAAAPGFYPG
jgi:cyclic dehypoxanthinyl futalosine synthase